MIGCVFPFAGDETMEIARHRALALLARCDGDEIWSVQHCRESGVPAAWIERMQETFESGFRSDAQTIYVGDRVTNQYRGVRAVDLAIELGRALGIDVDRATGSALSRRAIVQEIQQAVADGE